MKCIVVFSFWGGGKKPLTRGSAPRPRWGHSPQTPIIGSHYRARHSPPPKKKMLKPNSAYAVYTALREVIRKTGKIVQLLSLHYGTSSTAQQYTVQFHLWSHRHCLCQWKCWHGNVCTLCRWTVHESVKLPKGEHYRTSVDVTERFFIIAVLCY